MMVMYAHMIGHLRGYVPAFFVGRTDLQGLLLDADDIGNRAADDINDLNDGRNVPDGNDELWHLIRFQGYCLLREHAEGPLQLVNRNNPNYFFIMYMDFLWPRQQHDLLLGRSELHQEELLVPPQRMDAFLQFLRDLISNRWRGPYTQRWNDFH